MGTFVLFKGGPDGGVTVQWVTHTGIDTLGVVVDDGIDGDHILRMGDLSPGTEHLAWLLVNHTTGSELLASVLSAEFARQVLAPITDTCYAIPWSAIVAWVMSALDHSLTRADMQMRHHPYGKGDCNAN